MVIRAAATLTLALLAVSCSSPREGGHARADCAALISEDALIRIAPGWRRAQWDGSTCVLGPDVTGDQTGETFVQVWLYCDVRTATVDGLAGVPLEGLGRAAKRDVSDATRGGVYFVASRARCQVQVLGRGVPMSRIEAFAHEIDAHLTATAELPPR